MKTTTKRRGFFASVGAVLTAAALALSGAGVATAATDPVPVIPDATAKGSLTITKLSTPNGDTQAGNGVDTSLPNSDKIGGVTYSIQQVTAVNGNDIALSTNDGWQKAQKVTYGYSNGTWGFKYDGSSVDSGNVTIASTTSITTGSTLGDTAYGTATASNLPIGLYLVTETDAPNGVLKSDPFLVTIPITDPDNKDAWLYDVYVYPKNSQQGFTKQVDDSQAFVPGDTITWTLNADVPRVNTSTTAGAQSFETPTEFTITDTLDEQLNDVATGDVTVKLSTDPQNALTDGDTDDYLFNFNSSTRVLSITFKDQGLTKLRPAASTAGAKVVVTISSTVKEPTGGATLHTTNEGVIQNGGASGRTVTTLTTTVPTAGGDSQTTTQYANTETTEWEDITFSKIGTGGSSDYLEGAVFKLYKTKGEALDPSGSTALVTSAASTSGAANNVVLPNVRASDWQNGTTAANRVYWLVETTAPENHELLAQPISVIIGADGKLYNATSLQGDSNAVQTGTKGAELTSIVNVEKNAGFTLPLTGGTGTLVLTIGGIAILAVVLLVARRRRNSEAAAE